MKRDFVSGDIVSYRVPQDEILRVGEIYLDGRLTEFRNVRNLEGSTVNMGFEEVMKILPIANVLKYSPNVAYDIQVLS